jgi:hypothetical protein
MPLKLNDLMTGLLVNQSTPSGGPVIFKNVNTLAILLFIGLSQTAMAKGLTGTKWKALSYKFAGEFSAWTDEEAKSFVGKTVAFEKTKVTIGGKSCKLTVEELDKEKEKDLLQDTNNACDISILKGPVYSVDVDDCGDEKLPPNFIVINSKSAMSFGDGISICFSK